MYIKRYTIATLILAILTGWYVYSYITQDSMGINFFGTELPSLSIALWVIVPVFILYVASVAHMVFYSAIANFKLRKDEKDYDRLIEAIAESYLGKETSHHYFKTDKFDILGSLVENTTMFPTESLTPDTSNEQINSVIKAINDIKKGEVADLRKYSLSPSNPLVIQNHRNRYKKGDITAEDILLSVDKYDKSLYEEAYTDFVKTAPNYAIEQYRKYLTKESLFEILARINASENTLDISNEELIGCFNILDLARGDYLKVASILATQMLPEQRISLFETLSESDEEAVEAYLFTLFDLEMIAPANDILDNSQSDEYLKFKAYRALKECNKNFNINLFI